MYRQIHLTSHGRASPRGATCRFAFWKSTKSPTGEGLNPAVLRPGFWQLLPRAYLHTWTLPGYNLSAPLIMAFSYDCLRFWTKSVAFAFHLMPFVSSTAKILNVVRLILKIATKKFIVSSSRWLLCDRSVIYKYLIDRYWIVILTGQMQTIIENRKNIFFNVPMFYWAEIWVVVIK